MNLPRKIWTRDSIATSGVIHVGISDHSIIYAVRKCAVPKTRLTIKEVQNFKHFVNVDLSRVSWQDVECFDDRNLAWQAWNSHFNAILDNHAPIRHMRVRQSPVPWLTFDIIIKKMMKQQDYHKNMPAQRELFGLLSQWGISIFSQELWYLYSNLTLAISLEGSN